MDKDKFGQKDSNQNKSRNPFSKMIKDLMGKTVINQI